MADRLDDGNNPDLLSLKQEVAALRQELNTLKQSLDGKITAGAEAVLSSLTISMQNGQVSGSGRSMQIIPNAITDGQINAVGVCEDGQMIVSGTVTFP